MAWREVSDLRAALQENAASLHAISLELAAKDVEAQAIATRGEHDLKGKQRLLKQLREQASDAPAKRAASLAACTARSACS